MDLILNGKAIGNVAETLLSTGGDPNMFRPWVHEHTGKSYITTNRVVNGQKRQVNVPVTNANATLQRYEWIELDRAVMKAALPRLSAVADLRSRGLTRTVPNGMGTTVLQYQRTGDINGATISMDGLPESPGDRPVFDLSNLPLPIIHKDFNFSARQIATSRKMGMGLDTTMAELAARKVAEGAEQLLLGVSSTYSYGGGAVYGYTNFPGRITKTMTLPTTSNQATTIAEVIDMRQKSYNQFHFGPFVLYVSPLWASFLDGDYILTGGNVATQTLRERLTNIDGITGIKTLDYLKGYDMVLVELNSDVVQEVVGMDITTLQWETKGGMQLNFKVMCILVPLVRGDFNGNTGIVHGAVSGHTETPTGAIYLPNGNP